MTKTLKALSALLSYPTEELKDAVSDMRVVLEGEALVEPGSLEPLLGEIERLDLYELQERYVFLFDRTRSLSLHLFEHVHGESRDRGQAMVDLRELYARNGLDIDARELPDFLPLFLEFLSTLRLDEARALLAEPSPVIAALGERLRKRGSSYANVFEALVAIGAQAPAEKTLNELRKAPDDDPNDFAAVDAAWEEKPVLFGPGEARCPTAAALLDRMRAGAKGGAQ
jgi:nitrate reductase delta subunit